MRHERSGVVVSVLGSYLKGPWIETTLRYILVSRSKNLIYTRDVLKNFTGVLGSLKEAQEPSDTTAAFGTSAALHGPFVWPPRELPSLLKESLEGLQTTQAKPGGVP